MTKLKKLIPNFRSPAYRLVGETARKNWWLIGINLVTNLISAVLEGSTLGVIYLAIGYLTGTDDPGTETATNPRIAQTLAKILPLPPEQMFLVLIFGAVVLQIGLSLSNYVNNVSTAYLSAKAQPYVTGKVFERIMTFSYGCVSRYKREPTP
ncbi:hypothetical protein [Moorena sp. SIO3I6]|uniref:hypothetical protein n=1 Tax=Moorena sp. SIO3I6 TaxID=2607831 RepID=UPI0025FF9F24|nr:hypothetical protein [Moorena sp. SIO3I6]